jgi:hypothetical protein
VFIRLRKLCLICVVTLLLLTTAAARAFAQGTAFIYQGRLTDAGNPANGTYEMQFKLFDTLTVGTGTQQGTTITNPTVQVTGVSSSLPWTCFILFD